jgi:hypothetical protein
VAEGRNPDELSRREREVIDALSRPLREGGPDAAPATNQKIAGEVFLSLDAVKGHLRTIYAKLGLEELPQNRKRAELARLAHAGELDGLLAARAEAAAQPPAQSRWSWRLSPATVLAGLAFVLLAALAVARVVPGGSAPAGQTAVLPDTGGGGHVVTVPRPAQRAEKGGTTLLEGGTAILPASFAGEAVESDDPGGATTETTSTETAPPVERKLRHATGHVKKTLPPVKATVPAVPPPAATVTAPAPQTVHCVSHTTRVKKRVVVWRRVPRRVKVRTPHRKVRIVRTVYYTRKRVVTYDRRGRRHVTWVQVRHVRITRQPYVVWRVRFKRRMVRVRRVVTRVQLVTHRTCT